MLRLASEHGVRLGAAPDTFLGAGIQTCLQCIREGAIGEVHVDYGDNRCEPADIVKNLTSDWLLEKLGKSS